MIYFDVFRSEWLKIFSRPDSGETKKSRKQCLTVFKSESEISDFLAELSVFEHELKAVLLRPLVEAFPKVLPAEILEHIWNLRFVPSQTFVCDI